MGKKSKKKLQKGAFTKVYDVGCPVVFHSKDGQRIAGVILERPVQDPELFPDGQDDPAWKARRGRYVVRLMRNMREDADVLCRAGNPADPAPGTFGLPKPLHRLQSMNAQIDSRLEGLEEQLYKRVMGAVEVRLRQRAPSSDTMEEPLPEEPKPDDKPDPSEACKEG